MTEINGVPDPCLGAGFNTFTGKVDFQISVAPGVGNRELKPVTAVRHPPTEATNRNGGS
jgi:hypothetical protein